MNSEYINQRRNIALELSEKFEEVFDLFPIIENKIVFSTFEGDGGFCCNPRYIAEEIHRRGLDYEMVWLTHDTNREFPEYITVVKDSVENIVYHLATAKVWIDNYRKPWGTLKRQGQIYIQTWHASLGFKAVGLYRGDLFPEIARLVSEADSKLIDYVISNSDYCDKVYPKKLLYDGPTLRTGSPRVDCLINNREKLYSLVRIRYGIEDDVKLVLFAPTFRGGNQKEKKQVDAAYPILDFNKLTNVLKEKFGGEWKVLTRLHPQLAAKINEMPIGIKEDCIMDVSQAPDMSEIMGACDVVVTDYSSCAFDAMFAQMPVFLYADDVQEYITNRGQFMWKKKELPFPIAENENDLFVNIKNFDINKYKKDINDFILKHGIVENGNASELVVDFIEQNMK